MQHNKTQDTLVGLFVASGMAGLFFMAMQMSNLGSFNEQNNYTISADFENSGGLKVKAPVVVGGVRVGRVLEISLDKKNFRSIVKMSIDPQYNTLPEDTTASIFTSGLLGEQYVSLEPGGSDTVLKNNSKLEITQSAIVLEEVLGQFLFKDKDADDKK
jgi:phospholipid/cholesterol/gamma-HCH transport system substrate-binding protein